jgi:glycosyltransferase involved in cell wall biosynthesis
MKILLLSDSNSSHTIKWVQSLAERNFEMLLFTIPENLVDSYRNYKNIRIESAGVKESKQFKNEGNPLKVTYLLSLFKIKKIIKEFKPDILHAHYATSYGLLGALSGFHPFILSVWGTDVISFPNTSFLHKNLLQFNFKKADKIMATSSYLAAEADKFTEKKIEVTPFGINTTQFAPAKVASPFDSAGEPIVIGCIKRLEDTYGIDYLIKAFKMVVEKNKDKKLKLLLVGEGSKLNKYKNLAKELKIEHDVFFAGKIPYEKITDYHNMMDIGVYLSLYESFGVAVLEASACGKAVVVSNVGGLPEVVENNKTGIIIEPQNIEQTAEAIDRLTADPELRAEMGEQGRRMVQEKYEWNKCVDKVIEIYTNLV